MKVLFVSSGNIKRFGISPIVTAQGKSLQKEGTEITYFPIVGKGALGYFKNMIKLRKFIQKNKFDIIHAHYSMSAIIATIANSGRTPIVVSLMGSDTNDNLILKTIIKIFNRFCWHALIVKSAAMRDKLGVSKVEIIPNGVDFELFRPLEKNEARNKLSMDQSKKWIVFIADPSRKVKNVQLAQKAVNILKQEIDADLLIVFGDNGIDHSLIPYYLSAADCLILTSVSEGSPNVVKEAMACNCPVVSTNVGDVCEIIKNTDGCFLTSFDPDEISQKLMLALEKGKTAGRESIKHLESKQIAQKLVALYNSVTKMQ
jgi:glycosyltransferase involved in cell wall biosynthesis